MLNTNDRDNQQSGVPERLTRDAMRQPCSRDRDTKVGCLGRVQDDTMLEASAGQFNVDSDRACRDVSGESRRPTDDRERAHVIVTVDLPARDPDDYFVAIETVLQINTESRH
jgi:hypothetical protein